MVFGDVPNCNGDISSTMTSSQSMWSSMLVLRCSDVYKCDLAFFLGIMLFQGCFHVAWHVHRVVSYDRAAESKLTYHCVRQTARCSVEAWWIVALMAADASIRAAYVPSDTCDDDTACGMRGCSPNGS